jgi:hypothetical protein
MAIFGESSVRLLREDWPTPTALAQELYAIFNSDSTIEVTSPVRISGSTPEAPLQIINNYSGGSSAGLQVVGNQVVQGSSFVSGQTLDFTPSGETSSTVGGQQFVPGNNAVYTFPGGQLTVTLSQSSTSSSVLSQSPLSVSFRSNVFVGNIVSGTGQTYRVKLQGIAPPGGTTVTVLFPMLATSETIPVGATIVGIVGVQTGVNASGSSSYTYYGSVPVWES